MASEGNPLFFGRGGPFHLLFPPLSLCSRHSRRLAVCRTIHTRYPRCPSWLVMLALDRPGSCRRSPASSVPQRQTKGGTDRPSSLSFASPVPRPSVAAKPTLINQSLSLRCPSLIALLCAIAGHCSRQAISPEKKIELGKVAFATYSYLTLGT